MNIRNRIVYYFSSITGVILLISFIIVYFTVSSSRKSSFNERLQERIELSEKFFLEINYLSPEVKQKIKNQFYQKLNKEIEIVLPLAKVEKALNTKSELKYLSKKKWIQIIKNKEYFFEVNNIQVATKQYNVRGTQYIVIVAAIDKFGYRYLAKIKFVMFFVGLFFLIIVIVVSRLFAIRILKPLSRKINKANRIGADNLNERLTVYNKNDEIGKLAIAFNNLLDRLEESFVLQKNFVRYASHELKNPLTVIAGEIEIALSKDRTNNEYVNNLEKIYSQTNSLNELIDKFLRLPDYQNIVKETFRIDEVIIDEIIKTKQSYSGATINLSIDESLKDSDLEYLGDRKLIESAINNIIDNAVKYGKQDSVTLKLELSKTGELKFIIKDKGIGISKKDINLIFEPLYRVNHDADIKGNGMGLYLAKRILDIHNISIEVTSEIGKGSKFELVF